MGTPIFDLATADAIGDPAVIAVDRREWWVAAPVCEGGTWRCRLFVAGSSGFDRLPDVPVDGHAPHSICMKAVPGSESSVAVAVVAADADASRVHCFHCDVGDADLLLSSPIEFDAHRPAVAVVGDQPIVVYDAWEGDACHVYLQCGEEFVRLSEAPGWHIRPDVVPDGDGGLWVTWLRTSDVVNPEDVVDSRCELMAARVRFGGDGPQVDQLGAIDDLSHGILDISPDPRGTWGYLGRRRHPMLLRTPSGVLALWEQKHIHDGSTRHNVGVLWSRRLSDSGAGDAVALAQGGMAYTAPGSRRTDDDPFEVCCFEGWHVDERCIVFHRASATALDEQRLPREAWRGWQPLTLPRLPGSRGDRPSITIDGATYELYWMDPHAHTAISADAEGEIDELYRYARRKARLDAVVMSDNDYYMLPLTRSEWLYSCEAAGAFDEPGEFVALPGYEWTCRREFEGKAPPDHRTVILPRPTDDIVRWNEAEGDYRALYDFTTREGGIIHAHHQRWRLLGDPVEANIEATSSWDVYLEVDPSVLHDHLRAGHRIGVFGGSDSHRRNPGLGGALTGVWAESLTREGIMEALRSHRCYATSGHRVLIDFRANGQPMGSELQAQAVDLTVRVASPVPITSVELIRDGEVSRKWDAEGARQLEAEHNEDVTEGEHFYYLRIVLEGPIYLRREGMPANIMPATGPRAWSSPIWVTAPPA